MTSLAASLGLTGVDEQPVRPCLEPVRSFSRGRFRHGEQARCVASSARYGSRRIRRATEWRRSPSRSIKVSNAASSPCIACSTSIVPSSLLVDPMRGPVRRVGRGDRLRISSIVRTSRESLVLRRDAELIGWRRCSVSSIEPPASTADVRHASGMSIFIVTPDRAVDLVQPDSRFDVRSGRRPGPADRVVPRLAWSTAWIAPTRSSTPIASSLSPTTSRSTVTSDQPRTRQSRVRRVETQRERRDQPPAGGGPVHDHSGRRSRVRLRGQSQGPDEIERCARDTNAVAVKFDVSDRFAP